MSNFVTQARKRQLTRLGRPRRSASYLPPWRGASRNGPEIEPAGAVSRSTHGQRGCLRI